MTNQRSFPRVSEDDPITAEWANAIADEFDRRRLVEGIGISIDESPSGQTIHAVPDDFAINIKTGSSGITAMNGSTLVYGLGTCRIYSVDALNLKAVDSTIDVVIYNSTLTAVGASKFGQAKLIGGLYFVDVESCS